MKSNCTMYPVFFQKILAAIVLLSSALPAFGMSPRVDQCALMVSVAQVIIDTQGKEDPRAYLKNEEAASRFIRNFGLVPAHVDFLEGLARMVFLTKLKPTLVDDALLAMYTQCARGPG